VHQEGQQTESCAFVALAQLPDSAMLDSSSQYNEFDTYNLHEPNLPESVLSLYLCSALVKQPNMFEYTYKGCAFVDSAMSYDCHQHNGYNLHEENYQKVCYHYI